MNKKKKVDILTCYFMDLQVGKKKDISGLGIKRSSNIYIEFCD